MRKVIAFIVLGALVSALLSSPAQALNYDPRHPRPDQVVFRTVSGDDIGIDDPQTSPPPKQDIAITYLISWNWTFVGFVIYDFVIDTAIELDDHGSTDSIDIEGSSRANPQ